MSNLYQLNLYGNTSLSGCIPASLRGITLNDLRHLDLEYCTTTTTYTLTTSAVGSGRVSPLPGTYSYLSGASVAVTATPDEGYRVASWGDDCSASGTATTCALTMDADMTASVTFELPRHTLTVTAGEGGSVTPDGTTTHDEDAEVTLTASWNDATHSFPGWGGDCAASDAATTCVLTMDADKTATATFAALPATRCATTTATDCIRAVYLGAPGDYAQVSDIPADVLLTPAADGRYYVDRGQQYTVVTAAPLPTGWTRFYLDRTPLGTPSPVSASQLIKPIGTTYTFTVTDDEAAATLITFDLKEARPFVRPRPDGKPEIGDTVVTTVFSVVTVEPRYNSYDTTSAVSTPGSYAFLSDPDDTSTAVTTYEALRDGTTTALLIHKSDAHDASQAALYDAVEAGDLFEWHKADDCFVRYSVTRVKPDPTGDVPKKALDVAWMTYAFTGCSGTISTSDDVQIVWGALPNLGGDSLTVPVIHGVYQIAPRDWDGTTREVVGKRPPRSSTATYTENIVVARTLDFWREPTVPDDWVFYWAGTAGAESVSGTTLGYCAEWAGRERSVPGAPDRKFRPRALEVCAHFAIGRYGEETASWNIVDEGVTTLGVHETRVVAGRPALFRYSPPGPQFDDYFPIQAGDFRPGDGGHLHHQGA